MLFYQKSPTPTLEDLPVPQFESDSKKTTVKLTTKQATGPAVEGTSVAPRQRPKGSSSQPLILNNISLTLNPSPTTVMKKSQSPVTSSSVTDYQSFTTKPTIMQSFPQGNYSPSLTSNLTFASTIQEPSRYFTTQKHDLKDQHFDDLFQSSIYPDPFRDDTGSLIATTNVDHTCRAPTKDTCVIPSPISPDRSMVMNNSYQGTIVTPTRQQSLGLESSSQCVVSSLDTPPPSPSLNLPKGGHRRNMSDTTAFNKYVMFLDVIICLPT